MKALFLLEKSINKKVFWLICNLFLTSYKFNSLKDEMHANIYLWNFTKYQQ